MIDQLTHYEALGVSQSATQSEIRSAYKALVLKFHPDKNEDKESATTIFNRVHEAYQVLTHEESRNAYDLSLYLKAMADDRTSIIEETASTIFDGPDSPFDGLAFSVDCLKQSMDESICEEFQCFKSSLIRFLFGEENNDYAPKKPFDFEEFITRLPEEDDCEKNQKDIPSLHSRSHKISKNEKPKVRINKKN